MIEKFKKYHQYTLSDFAMDEEYMDAIWHPTDEKAAYWDAVKEALPHLVKNMDAAAFIIKSFQPSDDSAPDEVKDRIWQQVLEESQTGKVIKLERRRRNYGWAAAAIILVILGGAWFVWNSGGSNDSMHQVNVVHDDIAPGGDRAVLTLADGTQIILDSAGNGLIAQEGNAKVVKLKSGEIAYDAATSSSQEIHYNTISTPRGGQYQVTLPDGTKVWLNNISSIRFPTVFGGMDRSVEITGEAYFEVAPNPDKPFKVSFKNSKVEVLGTHFNISAYQDENEERVTLLEGSVKIFRGNQSKIITPEEQAVLSASSDKILIMNQVDVDQVVAWKNGFFQFSNADIRTVMNQIARWYDVQVEYEGRPVTKRFEGTISRSISAANVFKILEATEGASFKIEGNKVIVKE